MVGLMMESQSEENTKPSSTMDDDTRQHPLTGKQQEKEEARTASDFTTERWSDESTKSPSTINDTTRKDRARLKEEEDKVFKKPMIPSKTGRNSPKPEGDETIVFKKPMSPSKPQRPAIKVEEEEEDGEAVFKKPVLPTRTHRKDTKAGDEEDVVFKKPVSVSKPQRQTIKTEEEEDAVFKKPVFISKAQRQVAKADGQQEQDDGCRSSDQDSASSTSSSSFRSPAQSLGEKSAAIPYKEPKWSGVPQGVYSFEVLKSGVIMETIPLNRPFTVIGRQSQCDLMLEHPSLSRFHCVIQYRAVEEEGAAAGFYAYDLGSTHGSFHNKNRMKPHTYYRLRVGHMLKLAGSTRTLILQGPEEDQEPESELSVSELMLAAAERKKKLQRLENGEDEEEAAEARNKKSGKGKEGEKTAGGEEDDTGISWGIREDAEEEDEEEEGEEDEEGKKNPFASVSEELHLDDPKKTLRGWFERHGYDPPSYTLEEISPGCCRCSVELPVEAPGRPPVVVSVDHRGRRKEAVVQCAMEACRTLDRRNLLRQAKHEGHQHRKRDWAENDYYDSDEDDFLDRTGDIQRRRLKRMKASAGAGKEEEAETYDSLLRKYRKATEELSDLEGKLAEAEAIKEASKTQRTGRGEAPEDDLESFMSSLKSQVPDKHKRVTWKLRAIELRKEELKLRRLVNIARPLGVSELQPYQSRDGTVLGVSRSLQRPGQAGHGARFKGLGIPSATTTPSYQAKEPDNRVHKIFLEEEPKPKLKLRRLDDDDGDEIKPVVTEPSVPRKKEERSNCEPRLSKPSPTPVTKTIPSHQPQKLELQKPVKEVKSENLSKNEDIEKASLSGQSDKLQQDNCETSSGASSGEETLKKPRNQTQDSNPDEGSSQPEKKAKLLGPTLPPHLTHLKTNPQSPVQPRKKEKRKKYDEDDPNYDTWVPPVHQSGDGRTALNDRLGY